MKQFAIILTFLLLSYPLISKAQTTSDSVKSDITLRTFVERESVPVNREVVYVVQLSWKGDLSRYKINQVLDPDLTNLTVRGTGSSNKVTTNPDGSSQSTKSITFYFKPDEMGMSYINGVTIRYEDTFLNQNESLLASRIGVKIVEPVPEPTSVSDFQYLFMYIIIGLIVLFTAYFIWQYYKKREEARLAELSVVVETIEEKYLRILKETIHITGNNLKEKLHDLTNLLSGYFSEKYDYSLSKMSTPDLLAYMENVDIQPNISEKINEFYKKSDLVRFAGETIAESEFHQLYDSVEWIIEKNKTVKATEEVK